MSSSPLPIKKHKSSFDISMFDASAARRLCMSVEQQEQTKALNTILGNISRAAALGSCTLDLFQLIPAEVVDKLEDKGFSVRLLQERKPGETHVIISW